MKSNGKALDGILVEPTLGHLVVLVALGGAVGASCRYGLGLLFDTASSTSLWHSSSLVPTFGANVLGSFLLGIVYTMLPPSRRCWRAFWGTGVLGGFTTFSTVMVQAVHGVAVNTEPHQTDLIGLTSVSGYVAATVTISLLSCYIGIVATGRLLGRALS